MSYLYVPGLVGLNWASSVPPPMPQGLSVTLSGKLIASASFKRAWRMGILTTRLYGLTLKPSTLNRGAELWISSLRDSRANRLVPPESGQGTQIPGTCGHTSCDISNQLSLPLSFVKTSPASLPWGLSKSAKTYKDWAIALRRAYLARRNAARPTSASGSSSLPTPTAMPYGTQVGGGTGGQTGKVRMSLNSMAISGMWPTPTTPSGGQTVPEGSRWVGKTTAYTPEGRKTTVALAAAVKMWPTPTSSTGGPCKNLKPGGQVTLQTAVAMWPTPREQDAKHGAATPKEMQRAQRTDLLHVRVAREAALTWPTPQAHDAQKGYAGRMQRASAKAGCRNLNDQVLVTERQPSGHLNPDWVSLMMGFPPHWTQLKTRGGTDGNPECQG